MSFRALLMLILLAAAKAAHAAEADWSIAGVRGTLSGSFQEATPGAPIVIVVPGSGPSDRNGNVGRLRSDTYRLLADDLSKAEISTLRYDKYGVGKSSALKEEKPPSIGDQAEDVRLWVKEVRSHYPNAKVILLGHSEGALIAELASVELTSRGWSSLSPWAVMWRMNLSFSWRTHQVPQSMPIRPMKSSVGLGKGMPLTLR